MRGAGVRHRRDYNVKTCDYAPPARFRPGTCLNHPPFKGPYTHSIAHNSLRFSANAVSSPAGSSADAVLMLATIYLHHRWLLAGNARFGGG
ncbi:hypothetical protein KCP74_24370 [Salmonella enterica subsp. enterica]|nr:hypothetical protein KCP74_24370 [Salmonella enterica subsp. enterica]